MRMRVSIKVMAIERREERDFICVHTREAVGAVLLRLRHDISVVIHDFHCVRCCCRVGCVLVRN